MILKRIQITNFRCIEQADLAFPDAWAVISGPNGAGKTSIIEAAHVVTRGRSFRQPRADRLIRHGSDAFRVVATLELSGRERRVGVEYSRGGHQVRIDGRDSPNLTPVAGELVVQVLEPDSHLLISEGPEARRRFLDYGVFHVERQYLPAWQRYRKALRQRNAALKSGANAAQLAPWDEALAAAGETIDGLRNGYVQLLRPRVAETARRLGLERTDIAYRPGWDDAKSIQQALSEALERDRALKQTTVGPHRADLRIAWSGRLAKSVVSRGQQKLLATALILAQARLLAGLKGDRAVMLVDDPAAELDPGSLGRLMAELREMPGQLVVTSLSEDIPGLPSDLATFHVEHGVVS